MLTKRHDRKSIKVLKCIVYDTDIVRSHIIITICLYMNGLKINVNNTIYTKSKLYGIIKLHRVWLQWICQQNYTSYLDQQLLNQFQRSLPKVHSAGDVNMSVICFGQRSRWRLCNCFCKPEKTLKTLVNPLYTENAFDSFLILT